MKQGATRMLLDFARAYPGRSALTLFCLLLAGLLDGIGLSTLLAMLKLVTDEAGDDEPSLPEEAALAIAGFFGLDPTAGNLLMLAILMIALKAILTLLANRQVGYTVAHVATDLRLSLIRALMTSRWRYYLRQPIGSLTNAVATEAQRASEGFQYGAAMAALMLNALIYLALALLISWQASLVALGVAVAMLMILNLLIGMAQRAGVKQTVLLKSLLSDMTDQLTSVKPLKAMAKEGYVDTMLSNQTRQLKKSLRKQVFAKEALNALQEPLLAILIGVGFFLALVHMDMELASVLVMVFLLARGANFMAKAQKEYQQVSIRESAYWSLVEAIESAEIEREPPRGTLLPELKHQIHFDRVTFAHAGHSIIKAQSMTIPAHRITVITGPSGAGKTTLLDLVVGLLHADEGSILIDDQPLNDIDHRRWRRRIGYVPQEPLLLSDSIRQNITLGESSTDDTQVIAALKNADAWDFVSALPEGLDATVGERGGKLSGGQRQRIAIARALIHDPQLLILDEATSSLDSVTEQAILATLERLRRNLTLLAVTHHSAMVDIADRVYRLENGKLTLERG